jgi:endonuclease IV
MEYGKLKCLPKEKLFTKIKTVGGNFGKEAKTAGYSEFGLLMERVLELSLKDREREVMDILTSLGIKPAKLEHWDDLIKHYREFFEDLPLFGEEWVVDPIQGHPDCVIGDTIFEMKTAFRFGAMRSETILQVLSYFCLAKKLGKNINKVGLILPTQNLIVVHDLSGWNWEPFWEILVQRANDLPSRDTLQSVAQIVGGLQEDQSIPVNAMNVAVTLMAMREYVGYTIKKDNLYETMVKVERPIQFFLSGNLGTDLPLPKTFSKDKFKAAMAVRSPRSTFVHLPYTLNLSNPEKSFRKSKKDKENDGETVEGEEPWVITKTKRFLEFGDEIGLSGMVIHCGKKAKLSQEDAIENMVEAVKAIAPFATPECPLLVETSAGQCGELFSDPETLASFYISLPPEVQANVKICFDSCHVFAAGHHPMHFLSVMDSFNIPIHLFHYNDSKLPLGSRKDRHAPPLMGHLGAEILMAVLQYAIRNNIPCVHE